MRQYSDDEEGFIPSDLEIKNKYSLKLASISLSSTTQHRYRVNYRYSTTFIKKEHPKALITPLTIPQDPLLTPPLSNKNKAKFMPQHPYKYYCCSNDFILLYSRHTELPFTNEHEYMKNEVPLLNLDDRHSPSLKELKCFQLEDHPFNNDDLVFDSKFQNGNLCCAFRKRNTNQYHLFLDNDTNTMGYNQWFYFSLRNTRKGVRYTFLIVNYRKRLQFFQQGQRVALFSLKDAEQVKSGWRRAGNRFSVQQSNIRSFPERKLFTLSFTLQFAHQNDFVLLASSVPYSYSKLLQQLKGLEIQSTKNKLVKFSISSASLTVCSNQVPQVTITSKQSEKKDKDKKMLIIMARQHPGQVWSSYVAEGIMRSLLKETPENKFILENFIIKIFPMINVDGVIYGNFRCDVTGVDLNRRWSQPSRIFHPHLLEIKKKIISYSKKWKIDVCFDLHGHSKKYNMFCYSCKHNSYTCRVLPLLIQNQTQIFHMPSCTFGLARNKEATARATISRIIRSQNVLTIETSAFGWRTNNGGVHFQPIDLHKVSESILTALSYFLDKKSKKYQQADQNIRNNFSKFQQYDQQNQQQSGSDSEPQQDQIDFKVKIATVFDKKFEQQYKSFLKDQTPPQLHCSQIIFKEGETIQENSKILNKLNESIYSKQLEQSQQLTDQMNKSRQKTGKNSVKNRKQIGQRIRNQINIEKKKSISMNHSQIGIQLKVSRLNNSSIDANKYKSLSRNIVVKQKKRFSLLNQIVPPSDIRTLNPREVVEIAREQVGRSNLLVQIKKQEEKHIIQSFVNKYQRFIPNTMIRKNKARLDLLQQGLQKDDTSYQLNVMLQNKKKIDLERIKRSIEDSTEIAERQGKVKMISKREPIIDFKRFKQNQKIKLQFKRLGEFSQRYIQGQY